MDQLRFEMDRGKGLSVFKNISSMCTCVLYIYTSTAN